MLSSSFSKENKKLLFIELKKDTKELKITQNNSNIVLINKHINKNIKIIIENNIDVELLEVLNFEQINQETYKISRELKVQKNSKVIYNKIQILNHNITIEYECKVVLKTNASLDYNAFEYGSKESKNYFNCVLKNKNAKLNINTLVKTKNKTQISNFINILHEAKNTYSSLTFKHILNDFSKVRFEALSKVSKTALFSQAYQSSNTILLSDDAVIFANPHLEIETNELKASHGATTGSLNEEELFYLQQRGMSREKSTNILLQAIESEIYDNISNKKIKKLIEHLFRSYYV